MRTNRNEKGAKVGVPPFVDVGGTEKKKRGKRGEGGALSMDTTLIYLILGSPLFGKKVAKKVFQRFLHRHDVRAR